MRCLIFLSCLGPFPGGGPSSQSASAVGEVGEVGKGGIPVGGDGGSGRSLPEAKVERYGVVFVDDTLRDVPVPAGSGQPSCAMRLAAW